MIVKLTRIDGSSLYINIFQIEKVEKKTYTTITMINGIFYVVVEEPDYINLKVKELLINSIREAIGR